MRDWARPCPGSWRYHGQLAYCGIREAPTTKFKLAQRQYAVPLSAKGGHRN